MVNKPMRGMLSYVNSATDYQSSIQLHVYVPTRIEMALQRTGQVRLLYC